MAQDSDDSGAKGQLLEALHWTYDRTIDGFAQLAGVEALADEYRRSVTDPDAAIDSLVQWTIAQAGGAGFLSGLGGVITLPVAIPANVFSVTFLQLRMVAAIAHIRGYDVKSEQVKTLVIASLCGTTAADALKDAGINVATKLTANIINSISGAAVTRINQAVGFRLLTKAGTTGAVNLSKFIPLVGGLVSGGIDAATTYGIAAAAKGIFTPANTVVPDTPNTSSAFGIDTLTSKTGS